MQKKLKNSFFQIIANLNIGIFAVNYLESTFSGMVPERLEKIPFFIAKGGIYEEIFVDCSSVLSGGFGDGGLSV